MRGPGRWEGVVIGVALLLPSLITYLYFVVLAQRPAEWQQTAYGVGKTMQFLLPVIWVLAVQRDGTRWGLPPLVGGRRGLAFGLLVMLGTWFAYQWILQPFGWLDEAGPQVQQKVRGFGVGSIWAYAALTLFYSAVHSGLEEYYWRWFVFDRLRHVTRLPWAILLSSLGFMAHHVIVLGFFFGWQSPLTYLLSGAVAVGGAFWAWLYDRTGSLAGPWLSHALVDVGIFVVGFDIVRNAL